MTVVTGVRRPAPVPVAQPEPPGVSRCPSRWHRLGPTPSVSVVVATRNRQAFLGDLVRSLEDQTLLAETFEVIVVDDGSSDGTWNRLSELAATTGLRWLALRLPASLGQGGARNAGVAEARGPVVAFTDDDCVAAPDWLAALTAPFGPLEASRPAGDLPALAVQGRTVPWALDATAGGPWARTVWVLGTTWLFETCNIAYRRADLQRAGGFPGRGAAPATTGGKAVGEDALLGWQAADRGVQPVFAAGAQVFHRHLPATYRQWLADHRGQAVFCDLVGRHPAGRRPLWHRWFLSRRSAALDLAVVGLGLALASRRGRWLGLAAPWVCLALPEAGDRTGRHPVIRLGQLAAGDLVGLGALVSGSLRHRRVVL